MKVLIHVAPDRTEEICGQLKSAGVTDVETHWGRKTLTEHMQGIDVLITEFATADVITNGQPSLKFIQCLYRGVDGIDLKVAQKYNVKVAHTGANIISTAEHTMALLLAVAKQIVPADRELRQGKWTYGYNGGIFSTYLYKKTLGIIGLGSIGREVAKRAQAFGMNVIGTRRTGTPIEGITVYKPDQLHEVLKQSDAVVLTTVLTPDTTNLIGKEELALMKSSAILINTARGKVVDPDALYTALASKQIAGAGIDVWYNYPVFKDNVDEAIQFPADQPFQSLGNTVITPHRGGYVQEARKGFIEESIANVARYIRGEPPLGLVDLDAGY